VTTAAASHRPGDPTGRIKVDALALLGDLVGVRGAVFYSVDHDLNAVDHALFGLTPELLPAYVEHFHRLDPMHPRRLAPTGRALVTLDEAVPPRALVHSTYYRDFLRPLGVRHEVELLLRDAGRVVGGISLLRGPRARPFAARELALLAAARPFVELAFVLGRDGAGPLPGLTPREAEIVRLVGAGERNADIARSLGIALPTVKTHLEHVFAKLGVRSRTRLVARLLGPASSFRPIVPPAVARR
jgi:DNA-binding CsgD family transcriptional regulator